MALPDFVCNAGAVIGYRSAADATPGQVLGDVEATITGLIREVLRHPPARSPGPATEPDSSCAAGGASRPSPPYAPES